MSLFSVGSDVLFIEALCYNNNNSNYIYTNNPLWGLSLVIGMYMWKQWVFILDNHRPLNV